ncbi:MAG: DUF1330 domain-containing protein [Actinomycetia bacterium]|nr:DUF1330 domain-containing protein [Actinomycetes bacterium]MCP4225971.1 DUF1330 domain-containing protein [Actinomycetes bacterium]MCP5031409.1 DUF1330 domain-containing protein [Actinomycetes bacterium]
MADPTSTYLVALLSITDPRSYRRYEIRFLPILKRYGGEIVGFADGPELLEGEPLEDRLVLLRFPDRAAADAWYHSDEYQELALIRQGASTARFVALLPELNSER